VSQLVIHSPAPVVPALVAAAGGGTPETVAEGSSAESDRQGRRLSRSAKARTPNVDALDHTVAEHLKP